MTLNNLANLHCEKNEFPEAEAAYEEALQIRRDLANVNPQTYLPHVAMTTVNLSIFYLQNTPDQEKSLALAKEALQCSLPFIEGFPAAANYARAAMQIIETWGLDAQALLQEITDQYNQEEE